MLPLFSENRFVNFPPVGNMVIAINKVTNGKKYTTQLETKSFTGNKEYTYHLKISEKTPGIMTAEDWIAFSQLINSNTFTQYKGKTLDDFGETMNGITTYYLLNDIDFKDVIDTLLDSIWRFLTMPVILTAPNTPVVPLLELIGIL